jgi:CBS domain-containing protein
MDLEKSAGSKSEASIQAHDIMTEKVITVGPDEPTRAIAHLLLDNRISAVPVINSDGTPIGMVSEGDLIGREEPERLSRRDWWLAAMTGKPPIEDFVTRLGVTDRMACDVMSAPLVTVTEQTEVNDIARLLAIYHIKRVPVVRDSLLVGIVSRADLLGVVASGRYPRAALPKGAQRGFLLSLFGGSHHSSAVMPTPVPADGKPGDDRLTADDFQKLVADFKTGEVRHKDDVRRIAAEHRQQRTKDLIDAHVFDDAWRGMLHHAREAAESGQKEDMLLSFPSQLCIDSGRAINVTDSAWPATLRGEPAEIYLRWERELKHSGLSLSSHVLDFPGGKPGDIGLFLVWGG